MDHFLAEVGRLHRKTVEFYKDRGVELDDSGNVKTQYTFFADALLQAQAWARSVAGETRDFVVNYLAAEPKSIDGGLGFYSCLDAYAKDEEGHTQHLRLWFATLMSEYSDDSDEPELEYKSE